MNHDDTEWDGDCGDATCPACGWLDPNNPDQLRAVASGLLIRRMLAVDRTLTDDDLSGIPETVRVVIRELAASAIIHPDIAWLGPGYRSTAEQPL